MTARNATKPVFAAIRREAAAFGNEMGGTINDEITERIERDARSSGGPYTRAGDTIGTTIGNRVSEQVTTRIRNAVNDTTNRIVNDGTRLDRNGRLRDGNGGFLNGAGSGGAGGNGARGGNGGDARVNVDVDKQSVLSRFGQLGKDAAGKFSSAFGNVLSSFFSGDVISIIVKSIGGAGLAYVLAPVLGAAFSSAMLLVAGGGFIGAGIVAAMKDPQIKIATKNLGKSIQAEFLEFGQNFQPGVVNFLERLVRDIGPQLKPIVEDLGDIYGAVTMKLSGGLSGFLQNVMPAVGRMLQAAAPLWEELAESLPKLGDDIAKFFDHISESGPEATMFLDDFLRLLGLILRGFGRLIETTARWYGNIRVFLVAAANGFADLFATILEEAGKAFGWIPGIGPRLQQAGASVRSFQQRTNAELKKIRDKTITVTIRQVFTTVGNQVTRVGGILAGKASGGIQGAANGGMRTGLTWVGENGPELIEAAPGSRVHSAGDSARMAAGSGGGGSAPIVVQLVLDGQMLAQAMVDPQRDMVRRLFNGNPQLAWGSN